MTVAVANQQRIAEVAERFPGWVVWTTAQGSPVATRTGKQQPPEPYDELWCQTIIADDWVQLESALAEQEKFDKEHGE
jgi:hypothetical protein